MMSAAINPGRCNLLGRMVWPFLFPVLIFLSMVPGWAQQHQTITSVISFEKLSQLKIPRQVEWVNPNGVPEKMNFIEMAIPIDEAMKKLTREFNALNYGLHSEWLTPRMIVIHSMDLGDLKTCLEQSSFLNDHIPEAWGVLPRAGKLPNGAQFFVDMDGTIYCLTPPVDSLGQVSYSRSNHRWFIRRHADANPVAIGIENVTPPNHNLTDLTAKQIESNARLVRWLTWMEGEKIDHLVSHHQLNEERFLDALLKYYHLQYLGKANRTKGRTDVGKARLSEILEKVNKEGFRLSASF